MLRTGEIQIAMMTGNSREEQRGEFHIEIVSSEEICLVVPKNRNLQGVHKYGFRYPWIDIRQLEGELFLLLNNGSRLRAVTDKVIRTYGMSPKTIEFSSIDTIWKMVCQGFGVALASDFQVPQDEEVELFSVGSKPITWEFIIMTRVGGHRSVPVQDMIDITKRIYQN